MFIRHCNKTAELQPLEYCSFHPFDAQSGILFHHRSLYRGTSAQHGPESALCAPTGCRASPAASNTVQGGGPGKAQWQSWLTSTHHRHMDGSPRTAHVSEASKTSMLFTHSQEGLWPNPPGYKHKTTWPLPRHGTGVQWQLPKSYDMAIYRLSS